MTMMFVAESPRTTAAGCQVEVITDFARFVDMRAEWVELFDGSPAAAPPLRFEWIQKWWEIYGPVYGDNGRALRIITVRREGKLIGVLPMYAFRFGGPLGLVRLRFITTGAEEFEETCAGISKHLACAGRCRGLRAGDCGLSGWRPGEMGRAGPGGDSRRFAVDGPEGSSGGARAESGSERARRLLYLRPDWRDGSLSQDDQRANPAQGQQDVAPTCGN